MTLKQRKLKQAIKHSKTLWEAAMKAGYSPTSRTIYQPQYRTTMNTIVSEALNEETEDKIKNDFTLAKELALKTDDLTNYNRANEDLARIRGMFKDKSEITTKQDVNPNDLTPDKIRETLREALKDDMQGV